VNGARRRTLLLLAATAVAPAAAGAGAAPFTRGLLFRIEAPGKPPSWVFGTMHSNDARVTRLPAAVTAALESSRRFAAEILLQQADPAEFFAAAQFDDGRRLADHFDGATLARVRAALGAAAPSEEAFARLKPWAVLLLLAQPPAPGGGPTIDEILADLARQRRMTPVGLELPDEQVAALDTIPVASQVALVHWTLAHRAQLPADHERAVRAWLAGDLAGLAALAAAPGRRDPAMAPHFAELTRHLVVNRSAQMAHRLFVPLREGHVFVAVGALHLHGTQGVPALVRDQGYRVTRVH
jgi:uncharacterized protein YbaP (TraB family)